MMNNRVRRLMTEAGYSSPELDERAQRLVKLVTQACISQVAMLGVTNFENEDVCWTVDVAIENIKHHFGVE